MKNKNRLFAIIISCVYAVTLAAYILFLVSSYKAGQKRAEVTFTSLTQITSNILYTAEPGTQLFNDTISRSKELNDAFDLNENLAGMQLSLGDTLYYSNPGDLSKSPASKSALVKFHSTTLNSKAGNAVTLTCAIYLLTPSVIYSGGRVAFIVILIFTVICAFFIVFSYWSSYEDAEHSAERSLERSLKEREQDLESSEEGSSQEYRQESQYTNDAVNSELDRISDWTQRKQEQANSSNDSDEVPTTEDVVMEYKDDRPSRDELFSNQDIEDVTSTFFDDVPEEREEESQPETKNDAQPIIDTSDESIRRSGLSFVDDTEPSSESTINHRNFVSSPSGLFSPDSGFGWESYLNTRLSSELVRAASQETDLSLLAIRIPDLEKGTISAKAIYSLILDTVKFQDLVFEKGPDGCTAIFQDTGIDQAITIADRLHNRIVEILSASGLSTVCGLGISSKSLRLISAERLIKEAEQAMNYALEDPTSPIIAYRVNPEKYRNYLNNDSN